MTHVNTSILIHIHLYLQNVAAKTTIGNVDDKLIIVSIKNALLNVHATIDNKNTNDNDINENPSAVTA